MYEKEETHRDDSCDIWMGRRQGQWLIDCAVKVPGGLKAAIWRARKKPTLAECADMALRHPDLAPRPYRLGDGWSPGCEDCVLALFQSYCRSRGWDPVLLMKRAYPDEKDWSAERLGQIRSAAEWQGFVDPPSPWTSGDVDRLHLALATINYHSLHGILVDLRSQGQATA